MTDAALEVQWFGSYSRGEGYPRSATLIDGLRDQGCRVTELHAPLFQGAGDRVSAAGGGGALRLLTRQTVAAARLAGAWFREDAPDVTVVGSGGLFDVPLLRFLQNIERGPCVYDAFIPQYDTVVRDRQLASPDSLRAKLLFRAERLACRLADAVLCDTSAHADLLARDYAVPRERFHVIPVAQPGPDAPSPLPADDGLRVLLVASFIPLHGVETVIAAAQRLTDSGIELEIIGHGQEFDRLAPHAAALPHVHLSGRFQPEAEVRAALRRAHVGLGVFGTTEKAARVLPLKAAMTLSEARALVTADTPAARDALGESGDAALLVPPGDADALASALVRLREDPELRAALATKGRRLYEERFTPQAVGSRLVETLHALVKASGSGESRTAPLVD